ncbi:uncharacterized protein [Chironomus tepperi]|uniref:uncharacterized protein n=1 Tax=Chironomus tepperi TaxID=113505 RepID=UPI00391F8276
MVSVQLNLVNGTTFYAGDVMKGIVHLCFSDSTEVKELYIEITGIYCNEATNKPKITKQSETFLHSKIQIFKLQEPETISGHLDQQFEYKLSHKLPQTSIVHNIHYYCSVFLATSSKIENVSGQSFEVKRLDDLNWLPVLRQPMYRRETKTYRSITLGTQSITLSAITPNSGYAIMLAVPVKVIVSNESSLKIESLEFQLEEWKEVYSNDKKVDTKIIVLSSSKTPGIGAYETKEIYKCISIPHRTNLSELNYIKMIKIKHFLRITGRVSGVHENLCVILPLVMGTIPLRGELEHFDFEVPDDTEYRKHLMYVYKSPTVSEAFKNFLNIL